MKTPPLPYCYKHPHPAVAVDLVIFTLLDHQLSVLLIERGREPFKGDWALPGGFVRIDEPLEAAAKRELLEETGVAHAYLEQVAAFGDPRRDPRERVISITYFAIINADTVALSAGSDASQAKWYPVSRLPTLAFDHHFIVEVARRKLIDKANRSAVALEFLGSDFTLTELQRVFEAVRGESLDKRNFRKWADSLSYIKATGKLRRGGQHRPAALYKALAGGQTMFDAPLDPSEPGHQGSVSSNHAYRRGYEDAVAALNKAMTETRKDLLRAINKG